MKTVDILGLKIHALNMQRAISEIGRAVKQKNKGYVCVTGVHGIIEATRNEHFRNIIQQAFLVTPDGMPAVWIGRRNGHSEMERVYGPDLMSHVCQESVRQGFTHFLYGGKEGVAQELKNVLEKRYPGIKIVGTFTPPFRSLNKQEEDHLTTLVNQHKPDIMWIGISTPKQEMFMAKHIKTLDTTLMLGVGAAFDIHTNRTQDAPRWMKNTGLQWLHRLFQEPRRLWKRYLINNSLFMWYVLKSFFQLKFQQKTKVSLRNKAPQNRSEKKPK